jgi:cytochrome c peroxidase
MMRAGQAVLAPLCVAWSLGCDDVANEAPSSSREAPAAFDPALGQLPPAPRVDPLRAALGAKLYADPGISADGTVSCATCHPLDRGGADGLSHSRGARGHATALNTPTIYNATYNFRFGWSGAYSTLENMLDVPVTKTMETTWEAIAEKVHHDRAMVEGFAAYPDGITAANVRDAIARYVDTLVTPDARFDQYLRGDPDALNAEERRGYETFKDLGCSSCHQGANVGGNLFQRFGVMEDYFSERSKNGGPLLSAADMGRYDTTKNPADRHVFRVPSLRNVALTAPYFHDGSEPTLEQAVTTMGRVQLGRTLTVEQVSAVVAFLGTLTGSMGGASL